jgi:hypothetical protein
MLLIVSVMNNLTSKSRNEIGFSQSFILYLIPKLIKY